jgi:hypothetical protein
MVAQVLPLLFQEQSQLMLAVVVVVLQARGELEAEVVVHLAHQLATLLQVLQTQAEVVVETGITAVALAQVAVAAS